MISDLAKRVVVKKVSRLIFKVDLNEVVGEPLFRQDNPCPVGVRSRMAGIEFHRSTLLVVMLLNMPCPVSQRVFLAAGAHNRNRQWRPFVSVRLSPSWLQPILQRIADQIQTQNGHHDGQPWSCR